MATVRPADAFLDTLRKSRLVDEPRLAAELDRLRAAGAADPDPKQLAEHLVRSGFLTKFQAVQLLQGKHRGFLIGGKYKVLDLLGAGGMGRVMRCEHLKLRSVVAVKVLKLGKDAAAPHVVERFHREARAAFGLNHPNVARAFDIDQDGDIHYIVMDYIDGVSLQELAARFGPLSPGLAANLIAQAACGLQAAADQGWVHRDIKPANLMLDRTGTVKVLDLGLARLFHAPGDAKGDNLTKQFDEKAILGTADYLAPEQTIDSSAVDIRADIYSLGATFYYLLTRRPPFPDGSVAQKLVWHSLREPDPITAVRSDVPPALDAIIRKMMAKKPDDRFPAPADVADALAPWADPSRPPPDDWLPAARGFPGSPVGSSALRTAPTRSRVVPPSAVPGSSVPGSGTVPTPSTSGAPTPSPAAASTRDMTGVAASERDTVALRRRDIETADAPPRRKSKWLVPVVGVLALFGLAGGGAAIWMTNRAGPDFTGPPPGTGPTVRPILSPNGRYPIVIVTREGGNANAPRSLTSALGKSQKGDRILFQQGVVLAEQVSLDGERYAEVEIDGAPNGNGLGLWKAPLSVSADEPLVRIYGVNRLVIRNMIFDGEGRVTDLVRVGGNCPGVRFENVVFKGFRRHAVAFAGVAGGRDKGEALVMSRTRVAADSPPTPTPPAAFAFLPGLEGKTNENVEILDSRIDGGVLAGVLVRSGATYVSVQRSRFFNVPVGVRYDKATPPHPLRLTVENNTFADVKSAFRLGGLPPADDLTRLVVRNNLFAGVTGLVDLGDAADAPESAGVKKLFADARGNVRDPEGCFAGALILPDAQLRPLTFPPLGTDPADDATFLRYAADNPLATAGPANSPVGAPPP